MKKLKYICLSFICMTALFRTPFLYAKSLPLLSMFMPLETPLLTNPTYQASFNIQLFYGDKRSPQVETYTISSNQLTYEQTPYISFSEGFMEVNKNQLLLNAVNKYRKDHDLEDITSYYNYQELEGYGFLSLTDGLHTLYRIDLDTYEVSCPTIDDKLTTYNQCVYHITSDNDHYYILAKQIDERKVIIYTINKDTFKLCTMREIETPKTAYYRQHYALDDKGNVYFIEEDHMIMSNAHATVHLPLTFEPEVLYYADNQIYALSTSHLFLNYATFNTESTLLDLGQMNLPNKFVSLVSLEIKDSVLYTLTYDTLHPLYRNYLTLYDLNTNNMLYCLAFNAPQDMELSLIGATIHP